MFFLALCTNLCKAHAFGLLFLLRLTYAPMTLGWSAIFIKTMTVMPVMAFECPPMLLAVNTMLVGPAHLLGFLGDARIDQLHLVFHFSPFHLGRILGLVVHLCIILYVLKYQ